MSSNETRLTREGSRTKEKRAAAGGGEGSEFRSREERAAAGNALRVQVPRHADGTWQRPPSAAAGAVSRAGAVCRGRNLRGIVGTPGCGRSRGQRCSPAWCCGRAPRPRKARAGADALVRYFDVFVEYAKASSEDLLIQISVHNRGAEPAALHLLPTLWFRNDWSWPGGAERPLLQRAADGGTRTIVQAVDARLGQRYLYCAGEPALLFTENETNAERIFGAPNRSPYVKDGIHRYVVRGRTAAVNPQHGTKVAAHSRLTVDPGGCQVVRLRLSGAVPAASSRSDDGPFGAGFEKVLRARREEADEFYAGLTPSSLDADRAARREWTPSGGPHNPAGGDRGWRPQARGGGVRSLGEPASSRRIRTGATICCFTNTSTLTTGRGSERASRRDGRGSLDLQKGDGES